mmetsp:Transcript_36435/g.40958  ORF Transcript_36435/g.40958 Transcript_36435/m.40958 type:complete len:221 (+) Transcript_36435:34-696(+)
MNNDDKPTVLLDSLPYIDVVHEDYEEYALALIEEEMKTIAPRSLKKIPPLNFRTPMMHKVYELLADKEDNEKSTSVPHPKEQLLSFQPKKIVKPSTIEEWNDSSAIEQVKSQYEAERIRILILESEKEEGVANWKDYITGLDDLVAFWMKLLQKQSGIVEEINYQRQQAQERQNGPELDQLNQDYQQSLYRRNELEYEVEKLRRERANDNISRKRKLSES